MQFTKFLFHRVLGSALLIMCLASFASNPSGALFTVEATGTPADVDVQLCLNADGPLSCQTYTVSALTLNIYTTILSQRYPNAGIKITTPGYALTVCSLNGKGYCIFTGSFVTPYQVTIVPTTFNLGGNVSGLTNSGLILQNNGGNLTPVAANVGAYTLSEKVASGSDYLVTVYQQPTGQICTLANNSGTVSGNVTNINVDCSANIYYVGNANGYAYYSKDDGVTNSWVSTNAPAPNQGGTPYALVAIFSSSNTLYAITADNAIHYSTDNGTTWTLIPSPTSPSSVNNGFVSGSNMLFVCSGTNVYTTSNYGRSWTTITGPGSEIMSSVFVTQNNTIYVGTNLGNVYYSTDSGETWVTLGASPDSSLITTIYVTAGQVYIGTQDENVYYLNSLTQAGVWIQYAQTVLSLFVNATGTQIFSGTAIGDWYSLSEGQLIGYLGVNTPLNSIYWLN